MPPIRRTLKNVVRNYSDAQVKVRESTSNDPWGPSSTIMCEIADLTYNVVAFTEIMQMIWKRLNDHGKNWRHVYKSLVLLDYLIKTGSDKVAQQCKENIFAIQTLKDFQYIEENKDQGMNVREKAKQLVQLLKDDERLKNERAKALKAKERLAQTPTGIGSGVQMKSSPSLGSDTMSASANKYESDHARPASVGEEEIQLQLALAMSKEEHDQEEKQKQNDHIKLQIALEESRKEAVQEPPKLDSTHILDLHHSPQESSTDPWGEPLQKPPPNKPKADPWAVRTPPGAGNDPWGVPISNSSNSLTLAALGSTVEKTSPWSPQPVNPNIDEAFDLLSNRDGTIAEDTTTNNNTIKAFDPLTPLKPSSSLNDILDSSTGGKGNKATAERFLGSNASLVNLDELVSTGINKGSLNPFSSLNSNPFEIPTSHVSMNQMQTSVGFTHTTHGTLLPPPIQPLGNTQTMHYQAQTVNPFL